MNNQAPISEGIENKFEYDGSTKELFGIWIVNALLSIITLGIYSFWGKTRIRKYIAHSFSLLNDRFEYTGTGKELFFGFLKALPVIIILYAPIIIWDGRIYPAVNLVFIPILYLIFVAIYGALRYRFSRTTWRGVRGKLTGSAFKFAGVYILRMILNGLTLGLLIPASNIKIYKFITDNAYFGNQKVEFDGEPEGFLGSGGATKHLFFSNIITLLLFIPTLGMSRFWYSAALARYQFAHTKIDNLRLRATYTGGKLLKLSLINLLIVIFTLGLGAPIVIQRNLKFFSDNVFIIGDIDTSGILQSDEKLGSSGEGLDGALELDSGFM